MNLERKQVSRRAFLRGGSIAGLAGLSAVLLAARRRKRAAPSSRRAQGCPARRYRRCWNFGPIKGRKQDYGYAVARVEWGGTTLLGTSGEAAGYAAGTYYEPARATRSAWPATYSAKPGSIRWRC